MIEGRGLREEGLDAQNTTNDKHQKPIANSR